jgi:GNAT superfamily N-acetyltransferase
MADVRRIREEETPAVTALWADYAAELGEPTDGLTDEAREAVSRHLEANASHAQATCLVADADGAIVGFVTAAVFTHPTLSGVLGDIEEIYVQPAHRRSGVGTLLAQGILDWIDDHGGEVMKVRIGRGLGEDAAIRFWESLGFESDMVECSLYPAADRVR